MRSLERGNRTIRKFNESRKLALSQLARMVRIVESLEDADLRRGLKQACEDAVQRLHAVAVAATVVPKFQPEVDRFSVVRQRVQDQLTSFFKEECGLAPSDIDWRVAVIRNEYFRRGPTEKRLAFRPGTREVPALARARMRKRKRP